MTLATDFLLGTLCSGLVAVAAVRHKRTLAFRPIRLWALRSCAVALAQFRRRHLSRVPARAERTGRGDVVEGDDDQHGRRELPPAGCGDSRRIFRAGPAVASRRRSPQACVIYVAWMLGHDEFRFVIYDYGSTLVILMLLVVAGRTHGVERPPRVHRVGHSRVDRGGRACSRAAFVFIGTSITTI